MTWRLFLDDERWPAAKDEAGFTIARSFKEAVDLIGLRGAPIFISFDHDLGGQDPTGFDLAKFIVEQDLDSAGQFLNQDFSFYVHSANSVGKKNIEGLLNQYLDYKKNSCKKNKI